MIEENYLELFNKEPLLKKELFSIFKNFLDNSGFSVIGISNTEEKGVYDYKVEKDSKQYCIRILLKNVCNSGWKEKPYIKRVQVQHLSNICKTTKEMCFLLGGITIFDDNPILVVWNPLRYLYHQTIRSAYVNVSSIKECIDNNGYHYCNDYNNEIFICDEHNFEKLLGCYYDFSYVEEIKW